MTWIYASIGIAVWLSFGVLTYREDVRRYPRPVIEGVDQGFRIFMALLGPLGWAISTIVHNDMDSWGRDK